MNILFADRMQAGESGVFHKINEKKAVLLQQGKKLYDMSIGTPDFLPPSHVIDAMASSCQDPNNYKYAINDIPELKKALIGYYNRRYKVVLKECELTSVHGTQEGLSHIFHILCNQGDYVLIPDPSYPIFRDGPMLAGANVYTYPLLAKHNYIPDLQAIPADIAKKAKAMIISYPLNPVGVTAPERFYREVIEYAKQNNIILIHDNAYSNIVFGNIRGRSFLEFDGAREVGIEFFSLSKSYNLTGARISFAVGNEQIIEQFKRLRSKIDYGMFLPLQYAAVAALNGDQTFVDDQCAEYEERARRLCGGFRSIGWDVRDSQGSMFVWCKIPGHFQNSAEFCDILMEKAGVICTPGTSFGEFGKNYVRFALVLNSGEIDKVIEAIDKCGVLRR